MSIVPQGPENQVHSSPKPLKAYNNEETPEVLAPKVYCSALGKARISLKICDPTRAAGCGKGSRQTMDEEDTSRKTKDGFSLG